MWEKERQKPLMSVGVGFDLPVSRVIDLPVSKVIDLPVLLEGD